MGYPGPYSIGEVIQLDPVLSPDIHIFHAGTKMIGGVLYSAGGRVFSVAAYSDSLQDAVKRAYKGVETIKFQGMHFRTDIAGRYAICQMLLKISIITNFDE
jgi:phosphoribosylamine--glycine ligase/phosphoribosylformylglycinamidine cyclo-ligase